MTKLRILLVEDSDVVSENLSAAIHEMTDAEVVAIARSEAQALEWMEHNSADVYIVDIMLRNGNGNGLEVLRQAKTIGGTWIVFSNHCIPEVAKMAKHFGADYVMDKSNEIETLMMTLQRLAKE